jgi:MFS family permease
LKNQANLDEKFSTTNEDKQEIDKQESETKESQKNDITINVPLSGWGILFISCFGVFMSSVSTSALIIAFPVVLIELEMTIETMMWVLLVLLLVIGAVVPTAGKLGDMIGQAAIYKIGYWLFVIGSLGAGFSSSVNKGYDLIACRVVIGIGAGLLFTNSSAILTNTFALYGKVGLSQGIMQLSAALGTVLGPLIGGGFADTNWRWIFWYNVPPGQVNAFSFLAVNSTHGKISFRSPLRTISIVSFES